MSLKEAAETRVSDHADFPVQFCLEKAVAIALYSIPNQPQAVSNIKAFVRLCTIY